LRLGRLCAALAALALAASCQRPGGPLRVGAKSFAEQEVLAEMLRALLEEDGHLGGRIVRCGDTFGCQQSLRAGRIDLMVEYTGTGFLYVGAPGDAAVTIEDLRASYQPYGLDWLDPLGFENGYLLVVPAHVARSRGLRTILDLADLEGGVRVTCPRSYLRRTGDGLASLLTRHGIRHRGEPLALDDPVERLQALFQGRADVAVVYATDSALSGFDAAALEDSLAFFPPYEAAVLARRDLAIRRPGVADTLARLAGRVDTETMRELNYAVEVEGFPPETVARRFLRAAGLLEARGETRLAASIQVAVAPEDDLESQVTRAVLAVRQVFPDRTARVTRGSDPVRLVRGGAARLGVVGAEHFFETRGDGVVTRVEGIEAVAVVGTRMLHLLRRRDRAAETAPLGGLVGLSQQHGAGLGAELVERAGGRPVVLSSIERPLGELAAGRIDAALLLVEPGDAAVASALADGRFELAAPSAPHLRRALPYLRPARIPGATYPGQERAVETLAVQVLLVGPSRPSRAVLAEGPLGALTSGLTPVTVAEADALVDAIGIMEAPDPVIPSVWTTWPEGSAEGADAPARRLDTFLNVGAVLFLVWLAVMAIRRRPPA
jgi:osmoprotectant transport system permease protein